MNNPQTWHHGLVARYWAEFLTDGGPEQPYVKKIIETSGQPVLDLSCGSGRLLIPYLMDGFDVDGSDYSQDMLDVCRQRAGRENLHPNLYAQANHQLDLPRRYKTIYCIGSIGIGGDQSWMIETLRRCYDHLRPGGTLVFDYQVRWNDPRAWMSRLPQGRQALPQEWPDGGQRMALDDGKEMDVSTRTIAMDPLEEVATRQMRVRLWQGDELLEEEIHTITLPDFNKNELVLMLKVAGFNQIKIEGDYLEEVATPDHKQLLFIAQKF